MKAISYQGPRKVSASSHSKPKIKKPTDALLRVTTTGICGSDLHMYDGRTPLDKRYCRRSRDNGDNRRGWRGHREHQAGRPRSGPDCICLKPSN
jgi:threonine dehydrogenase-like Zn-dependent dehydrogenase